MHALQACSACTVFIPIMHIHICKFANLHADICKNSKGQSSLCNTLVPARTVQHKYMAEAAIFCEVLCIIRLVSDPSISSIKEWTRVGMGLISLQR